jgi:phospholipid/cholesterol/gamma-HCH transport system substrate-binding protein
MRRDIGRWRALGNAGFALAVLGLAGFGLFQMASRRWRVQPTFHVRARFGTIAGLEAGHRVRLQGIDAGVVERVVPPGRPGDPVELVLRLDERLRPLVRPDAVARILAEGMVGARVVELTPGRPEASPIAEGGLIGSEAPVELGDLMKKTSASLQKLDEVARVARTGLEEIGAIATSVREGKGSLGKFVRDESAYQSLISLTRRGEKTVTALEDNLAALKHTWPLSRYFDSRAYYEREKLLFQPGSRRDSRTYRAEDLFEPGHAILTPVGRTRLDEAAKWCKQSFMPSSEVVIAAFTDDDHDLEIADLLTQEQAESVRKYLVARHGIDSAGWFRSRKVAAVGFGTQVPRFPEASSSGLPARRVDIILFTPQT